MHTLLVAVDHAGCAWEVVGEAAQLAASLGAAVVVMSVTQLPEGVPADAALHGAHEGHTAQETLDDEASTALADFAGVFERRGVAVRTEVRHGDVVSAILAAADDHRATMIVVGTHGRRGVARFFLGSVAEQVIRRAPCPVLTVRARDAGHLGTTTPARDAVLAEADG